MKIKYYKKLKNEKLLSQIRELLKEHNAEFVPPLSSRESSVQKDFSVGTACAGEIFPRKYYDILKKQSFLVAMEGNTVLGFLSFIEGYVSSVILPEMKDNIYISTIIVRRASRNTGVTSRMYDKLFCLFPGLHIFTRTWSTNDSHIHILRSKKFYEHLRIIDDRGEGIDTVYFHHSPIKMKKKHLIKHYRITSNIVALSLLSILTVLFFVTWVLSKGRSDFMHELSIALVTSLFASVLCLVSDMAMKISEQKNDEYITMLKSFGIENLQFHKDELLEEIIPSCREEIWISGYRLIMTAKDPFLNSIVSACSSRHYNINVRLLAVAPWSDTFRLVYGEEDVTDNYIKVIRTLFDCSDGNEIEIRFTDRPVFNDTYKVDNRFVTGPYLNCQDGKGLKITAKDFFSLDIDDPKSELYDIIYKDYMTIWETAPLKLKKELFENAVCTFDPKMVLTKAEKIEILKKSCEASCETSLI